MSSVVISGNTSGTITLDAPAVAGTTTLTLPTTSGTVALTASPTFTGQATIPTINLTGGQITFPATAVPSADANTLDDYEEGTWTPSFAGSTTNPVATQSNEGRYTKIGKFVFVTANMVTTALSSEGTGDLRISGFPFSIASGVSSFGGSIGLSAFFDTNPGAIQSEPTQTYVTLYRNINNTVSPTTDLQAGTFNNVFRFSFSYMV